MKLSDPKDMQDKLKDVFVKDGIPIEYRWEAEIQSELIDILGLCYGYDYVLEEYYVPQGKIDNLKGYAFDILVTSKPQNPAIKELVAIELKFIRHQRYDENNIVLQQLHEILPSRYNRDPNGWSKTNYERFEKDVEKLGKLKTSFSNKFSNITGYAIFITDSKKNYTKDAFPLLKNNNQYDTKQKISCDGWTQVGNYNYALIKV